MDILLVDKSSQTFYDFRSHSHPCWEIIYSWSGEGIAYIGDEAYPFSEGTIFCVPPETIHNKKSTEGFVDGCLFVKDLVPVDGLRTICCKDDGNQTFRTLFQTAFDIQVKAESNARAVINALGDAMIQLITGWSGRRSSEPVEILQTILLNNLSNSGFNLAEACRRSGYCASYLRKRFKQETGRSPLDYLNNLRIEFAKRQLQQFYGIRSIKEIALCSGFADPYYFSRAFKRSEGFSPLQYVRGLNQHNLEENLGDGLGDARLQSSAKEDKPDDTVYDA